MATELVTFKLDEKFLDEVDEIAKESGFSNRTDFIRNALREKVDEIKLKEAMVRLSKLKGSYKRKITNEEIHKVREKILQEMIKKKGLA